MRFLKAKIILPFRHSRPGSEIGVDCRGNPVSYKNRGKKQNRPSGDRRNTSAVLTRNRGSVLIYIIVVMMVFGLLGAAMVAMFSSATMMSTGTPNSARQARYLAEAGMRYGVAKLRDNYRSSAIQDLNDTEYTLPGSGKFDLNVFGKWFEASADYPGTTNVNLSVPEGKAPGEDIFSIPAGAYLVNLESYRDSFFFGGGAAKESFVTQIASKPALPKDTIAFEISAGDDFSVTAAENHKILLATTPSADQTSIGEDGDVNITYLNSDDWNFFPKENGSFYVVKTDGVIHRYYYESIEEISSSVFSLTNITGTEFPFDVYQADDLIILTERNHSLGATGSTSGAGAGGELSLTMDFKPNIFSPEPIPPPEPGALPEDISPSDFASPETATPGSAAGTVSVDTTAGSEKVTLGGNVGAASSAAWYGGSASIGGFDVCTDGKCDFNSGVRVFFIFDYYGTGDGFTFALASGANNGLDAYGGIGEQMGYAGTSPTGKEIKKPKLAMEFDTYTNPARNDPGSSNKDYLQYVYWGGSAADASDDNVHDTGGSIQKWEFTNPWGNIASKPAVDPDDGTVYIGSTDDRIWAINPDGSEKWRFDTTDNVYSSPALGADGTVYVGSDLGGGAMFSLNPSTGAENWRFTSPASNVRSGPVIGPDGTVLFGSWTNDNFFWAVNPSGSEKWRSATSSATSAPYPQVDGTPAVDVGRDALYFTSRFGGTGYLHFRTLSTGALGPSVVNLNGDTFSSPIVGPDGTVYAGSDAGSYQGFLFAVNPDGTVKWALDPADNDWNFRATPAVGTDGTIYAGTDEGRLWAINPDGTEKWRFPDATSSAIGAVRGTPLIHDDGSIWFGSRDQHLYAIDSEGRELAKFYLGADIALSDPDGTGIQYANSPAQGPDGTVYMAAVDGDVFAFSPTCAPQNIKSRSYTSDDLPADVSVSSSNNWLNSGPWAARLEVSRSSTRNSRNKYEYTLKMWLRQCKDQTCFQDTADRAVVGSYFEDTRIAYEAREPYLEQTIELCEADHLAFDTFIFGYTQGTGSAVQTIVITDTQLSFIRPGDFVVTNDPNWQ